MNEKFELRLVCYPRVIDNQVKNQYGFFIVKFKGGQPQTATPINYLAIGEDVTSAIDLASMTYEAVFMADTLYCLKTVDAPEWDGTLTF